MKRVLIFLCSVLGLLFITSICLELLGFFEIGFTITPLKPIWVTLFIIFSISFGGPILALILIPLIRIIKSASQPKFVRISNNLQFAIKRNRSVIHKLNIPQRKDLLSEKMLHIWMKADMQYPLSELDFDKLIGAKRND